MKVVNVHKRIINQSKEDVSRLLETLSTKDDCIWDYENWPAIRFRDGLKIGSKGGHGIIRYTIVEYRKGDFIKFKLSKPIGLNGIHSFTIIALDSDRTEVKHCIDMMTTGFATISWFFVIRWLHDALIEDVLDTYQNNFLDTKVSSKWTLWVRLWRKLLKAKKKKTKTLLSENR